MDAMNQVDVNALHHCTYVNEGQVCLCEVRLSEDTYGWVPVLVTVAAGVHARIWNPKRSIDRWIHVTLLKRWDNRLGNEALYQRVLTNALHGGAEKS